MGALNRILTRRCSAAMTRSITGSAHKKKQEKERREVKEGVRLGRGGGEGGTTQKIDHPDLGLPWRYHHPSAAAWGLTPQPAHLLPC